MLAGAATWAAGSAARSLRLSALRSRDPLAEQPPGGGEAREADRRHRPTLRGQGVRARVFQEHAAHDHKEVAHRIDPGQILHPGRQSAVSPASRAVLMAALASIGPSCDAWTVHDQIIRKPLSTIETTLEFATK